MFKLSSNSMVEGIKERSRYLYDILANPMVNRGYIAKLLYNVPEEEEGASEERKQEIRVATKRALSMFHQKFTSKSTISEEDTLKLFQIVHDKVMLLSKDFVALTKEMEDLQTVFQMKSFLANKQEEGMTPEGLEKMKEYIDKRIAEMEEKKKED